MTEALTERLAAIVGAAYVTTDEDVLDGRYAWLEEGILDPSIEGPWIAQDGGAEKTDVHRVIRAGPRRGAA